MKKFLNTHHLLSFSKSIFLVLSFVFAATTASAALNEDEVNDPERLRIQKQIVKINGSLTQIQQEANKAQTEIATLKEKIAELEVKEQKTRSKLKADVKNFYHTLMNLVRLQRVPTEALIAQDIVHIQLKRQALLNVSRDILDDEMISGKRRLENLIETLNEQSKLKKNIEAEYAGIKEKEVQILKLLDQQKQLFALNKKERKELLSNAKFMAGASSLEDLFERHSHLLSDKLPSLNAKVSQFKLPINGKIIRQYQQKDETTGLHSQGVTFLGHKKQEVKAIKSGRVIYSGPFRGYGYLVILEHQDDLHTLYAGFKKSNKKVGDVVNVAETVAQLSTTQKPTLYFEVRKNGQAINPVPYITN